MKKATLILISVISAVRLASASSNFSYTATGTPGNNPDGTDQTNAPLQVWNLILTPGPTGSAQGAYFGTAFGGETLSGWQIWTSPGTTNSCGNDDAVNIFPGGALSVGQTVSINFEMRATDLATDVGISLLNNGSTTAITNGSGAAITVGIFGGEPNTNNPYTGNGYWYTDAGSTYASAGSMAYQYQSEFSISFTVTGTNTYLATWGSDTWSGTFNGSLIGIDVFNHGAGNGSDVAFNNLTVKPSLIISNIFPNDITALFNTTNTFSFNAGSSGGVINASGIQLILNGVDVSSNLVVSGGGTATIGAKYTNLLSNTTYIGQINVTNAAGYSSTEPVRFDTFSTNYFTWEAEDFDFNGGQFIDNPVISTNSTNSYYGTVGVSNVDEYVPNYSATQNHLWRTNDQVSINVAGDTTRPQFTAAGIPDYLVGYFNPSNWVNYTKTFPAGTYNIYGRLANGNGGLANCYLDEVTNGVGTGNQMTARLGTFQFSARGWNSFDFIPLADQWGNVLAVTLNGKTTLRMTSGPLGGGVNLNFFMLAPGSNTPPAIIGVYPDGSQPFQGTNLLTFTVSSAVSTLNTNNIQVTLNGVNVSSQLSFTGSTTNWQVSLPLSQQELYSCTIKATDAAGNSHSFSETFDTFTQNNFTIEADSCDFNGGQFIDDPIETATNYTATNSYGVVPAGNPANAAVFGEDLTVSNNIAGETFVYRPLEASCGTEVTSDYLRSKFINTGQDTAAGESLGTTNTDCDVGWWYAGTWLNYTRTFPTNTYNVYGRLALNVPYSGATMSLVTAGLGTMNQATSLLGSFSDPTANGYQSWHWVELSDTNGNPVVVSLGGVETIKMTAPPSNTGGSLNAHFYMFVPAVSGPTVPHLSISRTGSSVSIQFATQTGHTYIVQSSANLNPASWSTLSSYTGDGTLKTATDSANASKMFYRVKITTP